MKPYSVLFFGTPFFASHALAALLENPDRYAVNAVVTQPDRPAGRGQESNPSPVKQRALQHGIPVLQPASVKKDLSGFLTEVKKFGPFTIGVVVAFGQIIPQEVLALPERGCVNVHASLLPRWRGAAPIQHAVLSGDTMSGVALMAMEATLDTGAVFSDFRVPLVPNETSGSLHDKLAILGAQLLVRDLELICEGQLPSVPQSSTGVTYAAKLTATDEKIQWQDPAEKIDRVIRALAPRPGAFTSLLGSRLKIFSARPHQNSPSSNARPGEVIICDKRTLEIQCGQGSLSVDELQLEGRKRLPVDEFLKGGALQVGTLLE